MHQRRDLGSLGFTFILFSFLFFSFLFFSFLFFLFFFYFRRFRADYFLVFLLSLYFLDLDVIVELKLNTEFNFFSNYYLECIGVQTNFWNSIISVSICSYSYDQKNAVSCNSVIEEPGFHLVNVVVRIYLSCSHFQQLVHFSLRIYFRLWVYCFWI